MTGAFRRFLEAAADAVWPRVCAVRRCGCACDRPGRHLCSRCFGSLPFLENGCECEICGLPLPAFSPHAFRCQACRESPPGFDRARGALRYEGDAADLAQEFKYRKALHVAEDFADVLEAALHSKFDAHAVDAVVPVPLHPRRLRERGFNQSAILAKALAARIGRRFDGKSLARRRDTEHQARIGGDERRRNLRAAFAAVRPGYLRGRTVLLVDDVMTTGSTFSECAKTVRDAGAARVWCLAVCRAAL